MRRPIDLDVEEDDNGTDSMGLENRKGMKQQKVYKFALWLCLGIGSLFVLIFPFLPSAHQEDHAVIVMGFIVPCVVAACISVYSSASPEFSSIQTRNRRFWCIQVVVHVVWFLARLLKAAESGKLARSGLFKCSVKAFGMNALLCMVCGCSYSFVCSE